MKNTPTAPDTSNWMFFERIVKTEAHAAAFVEAASRNSLFAETQAVESKATDGTPQWAVTGRICEQDQGVVDRLADAMRDASVPKKHAKNAKAVEP
jgi:hypothetical protein